MPRKILRPIAAAASRMPRRTTRWSLGCGTAARLLRPAGTLTLIWRADGLGEVLAGLAADFGAVTVLPVHPKPRRAGDPRAGARRQSEPRAAFVLPGFILADARGGRQHEAEAVLREGAALPLAGN